MSNMEYKGFMAAIGYDAELDSFLGNVINVSSPILFYGKSPEELRNEFAKSIETWLKVCEERGIDPEKPYSGRMTVRMPPALYKLVRTAAANSGKSVNSWVVDALQTMAQSAPV